MSTQTICDECKQPKPTPFKVTETDGTEYDICSGQCYSDHVKRMRASPALADPEGLALVQAIHDRKKKTAELAPGVKLLSDGSLEVQRTRKRANEP